MAERTRRDGPDGTTLALTDKEHNTLIGVVDVLVSFVDDGKSEISFSETVDVGNAGHYEGLPLSDACNTIRGIVSELAYTAPGVSP